MLHGHFYVKKDGLRPHSTNHPYHYQYATSIGGAVIATKPFIPPITSYRPLLPISNLCEASQAQETI